MANIGNPPYVFVNGTIAQPSQVNTNFNSIYNDYNGNITNANIAAAAAIALTKLASLQFEAGCRLTLTTATPITTSDVTAAATLYVTPYKGGLVPILTSGSWSPYPLTEQSITLSTLLASTMYDVYVALSGGNVVLQTVAWGSLTSPPARTLTNGILVNTAHTGYTLVGSFYNSGAKTTYDSVASRWVSNVFNAVPRVLLAQDATASWTYNSSTPREANGSSTDGTGQFSWVSATGAYPLSATNYNYLGVPTSGNVAIGIGIDITNGFTTASAGASAATVASNPSITVPYVGLPGAGYHYAARIEAAVVGTITFYGSGGPGGYQVSGMYGHILN